MYKEGFSIITVTNRSYCIKNLITNYLNQNFKEKELIIIINKNSMTIEEIKSICKEHKNIQIHKLKEHITLGECMNFGVSKASYSYIAKFDDDDYYSPYYLDEYYNTFKNNKCDVVGKNKTYYYLERYKKLILKKQAVENGFSQSIMGSTICFKREVFDKVKFKNVSVQEDYYFNRDCIRAGYKLFSTSIYNHLVFKHSNVNKHTFVSNLDRLMNKCLNIKDNISFDECIDIIMYDPNKKEEKD